MKKIVKHSMIFLAIIFVLATLYLFSSSKAPNIQPNIVEINRLKEMTRENIDDFSSLDNYDSPYDFFLLDIYGNQIYPNKSLPDGTWLTSLQNGYVSTPVTTAGGETAYILFVKTDAQAIVDSSFETQRVYLYLFVTLVVIVVSCHFLYLYLFVTKPLKKVEEVSFRISSGDYSLPVMADKNNVFGTFTQSFDIMRLSLAEAKENEIANIEERKDFVATIGHDLKLPLTSISAIAQLLNAKYQADPYLSEKLQTIEDKIFQIKALLDTMLKSEHADATHLAVELTDLDSGALLPLLKNSASKVSINVSTIPACTVAADIKRLEQIINNIVGNSEKYAGTDINVGFRAEERHLIIRIEDNGPGVPDDEIYRIWEKGFRGRDALGFELPGEGLGLYNVKNILLKMQGFPWAENTKNGFAVSIYLKRLS